jgi:hypothetical protein
MMFTNRDRQLLNKLFDIVLQNQKILKELKVTDAEVSSVLDQVNTTTNAIAAIQKTDADTLGKVKTELETLLQQPTTVSGLSDATSAKLQLLVTAIGTVQTNSTANASTLNAIAAEGSAVIPPPPPAPAPPPPVA